MKKTNKIISAIVSSAVISMFASTAFAGVILQNNQKVYDNRSVSVANNYNVNNSNKGSASGKQLQLQFGKNDDHGEQWSEQWHDTMSTVEPPPPPMDETELDVGAQLNLGLQLQATKNQQLNATKIGGTYTKFGPSLVIGGINKVNNKEAYANDHSRMINVQFDNIGSSDDGTGSLIPAPSGGAINIVGNNLGDSRIKTDINLNLRKNIDKSIRVSDSFNKSEKNSGRKSRRKGGSHGGFGGM